MHVQSATHFNSISQFIGILFCIINDIFKSVKTFVIILANKEAVSVAAAGHSRNVKCIFPLPTVIHTAKKLKKQGVDMMVEYCVTVSVTVLQLSHSNCTCSAGHIGNNNRLAKQFRKRSSNGANCGICISAGTSRDQNFDCLFRIVGKGDCRRAEHQHNEDKGCDFLEVFHARYSF